MNRWGNKRTKMCESQEDGEMTVNPIIINTVPGMDNSQPMTGLRMVETKILFYDDITPASILDLNRVLMELDLKLLNTKNILGAERFIPVIDLHVSTPGGDIFAGLSVVDTILNLKSQVHTYVDGCVGSAGTFLTMVGSKRFIGKNASMLIHQLSGSMYGKFSEMEDDIQNSTMLMKRIKSFYKQYSKIPMKKLDELLSRDLWLTPEECLNYGMVDVIL